MSSFDLTTFLPYQLAVTASHVSKSFADLYRHEFGLTIPEWRVLAHLAHAGAVSVREIHQCVDMDKSKVSRAAARLEQAGLIEKRDHPDDGRLIDIHLTDQGIALFARLLPVALAYQDQLLARLGPAADTLRRALTQLQQPP